MRRNVANSGNKAEIAGTGDWQGYCSFLRHFLAVLSSPVWEGTHVAIASCVCHNKWPQSGGFQGRRFAPCLESRCRRAALPLKAPGSCGRISRPVCLSPLLSLIRALSLDYYLITQVVHGDLISRSFISSAKTLFPNKVTFTGSGMGHISVDPLTPLFKVHFYVEPGLVQHSESKSML